MIIAIVGLAASPFVSLPYCRFGCPTGALLSFARSPGSSDRWSPRDWAALAVALFSFLTVAAVRAWPVRPVEPALVGLQGNALGTIWAVKVRDEVADPAALEKLVAREFDWAESMTSQWRTNTDLAEFNRAASTNATPMPWPVLTLARWAAEISGATGGAYDITAAPLLALWGWEPGGPALKEPSLAEVAAARAKVGWRKLELLDGMIRKQTPELQITLTSIAQGWSIDHVVQLLNRRGYSNVLVKVGGALRVSGTWQIGLESPRRTCSLTNEAVATSSASRPPPPAWPNRPVQLIDPRTGFPVQHSTIAVSVRHPDCAHAQAWATALNILGRDSGLPLADRLGLAAQFVVQGPGGALSVTGTRAWNRNEPPQGTASGAPR
ncbi:MAG: FAD:protein FMN transferase [Verrucomicrobiota bacterium]